MNKLTKMMIDNKKKIFIDEFPNEEFPWYSKPKENGENLLTLFDIIPNSIDNILSSMKYIACMPEEQSNFSIRNLLKELQEDIPKYIYFFSLNYNEILKFKFIDLEIYLLDFWEFDENVFLIDDDFQWCLFLFDDNLIYKNIKKIKSKG